MYMHFVEAFLNFSAQQQTTNKMLQLLFLKRFEALFFSDDKIFFLLACHTTGLSTTLNPIKGE